MKQELGLRPERDLHRRDGSELAKGNSDRVVSSLAEDRGLLIELRRGVSGETTRSDIAELPLTVACA